MGLEPVHPHNEAAHTDGIVRILPVEPMAFVGGPISSGPHLAPHPHPHGHPKHRPGHIHKWGYHGSFGQRLTRALMMLGPWEGRILAFVIGELQAHLFMYLDSNNFS